MKILYRTKDSLSYYEGYLHEELEIPPKIFIRIGSFATYGTWFDKNDLEIFEIPRKGSE